MYSKYFSFRSDLGYLEDNISHVIHAVGLFGGFQHAASLILGHCRAGTGNAELHMLGGALRVLQIKVNIQ